MVWSFFQLDNMDEKEQADRMAAAEALYMISTRVDKSGTLQKSPRKSRKKKTDAYIEDTTVEIKMENRAGVTARDAMKSRGRGNRLGREGRADGAAGGGRGGKGSSPRGRRAETGKSKTSKKTQRHSVSDDNGDKFQDNSQHQQQQKRNSTGGDKIVLSAHVEDPKRKSRSRTSKRRKKQTKSNSPSSKYAGNSHSPEVTEDPYLAIGFTGAAISINEPNNSRHVASIDSAQNLQSHGLISGFRQVSLSSRSLQSTATVYGLPSMNLTSFTSDLNLPSIPLEIGSLQLSSQPTPNLSSLADLADSALEDDCTSSGRKNSEKFLPLKKRKLLNPSEAQVREPTPPMDTSSHSDSEAERFEPHSPPPQQAEPIRASFTVQAPPIITMQTLMEIKTALTADDDGDLPLHIAVVHENMRMVIKLINLMSIAGKGVDKFNKQQQTPLHLAVKLNFLDAVDILLRSKANVNTVDCTGSSCIHMAVQGRSADCLAMLLERCHNADLNVRNFDGLTPLHIAVDNGDLQQVESLLKYSADIDVTDGKSGRTALFRAAESNQKAMVELLLKKGANPDVPNYAGVTTAMAAQGRNLHGVLKLLGLVSTDKFTEYETKPNLLALESKVTPVYLGLPPSDSLVFSNSSSARGIKPSTQEMMCLIEPKVHKETSEAPSNETKVFHNVFVVSQGSSTKKSNEYKSMSEPSSPEVKMDVAEDKDYKEYGGTGLMSLPEGIFCHSEEDRGDKFFFKQRSMPTLRQGELLQARLHFPAGSSKVATSSTVPAAQRDHKSVMLQIVPQPTSSSAATVVGTLTSTTNTVSSNILSKLSYMSSQPASSTPPVTLPSPSTPVTNLPASTSDTVTLTGMQARLFQMLLKLYNIDQSNETSSASSVSQLNSSPLSSVVPKLTLPLTSSSPHPAISTSVSSLYHRQEAMRQPSVQQIAKNFDKPIVSSHENSGSAISSHVFVQNVSSQHRLIAVGKNNCDYRTDNAASKDRDHEKVEESPLNLSTTSSRQNKIVTDSKRSETLCLRKSDVADSTSRTVHLSPTKDVFKGPSTSLSPDQPTQNVVKELSPVQQGSFGKVISIEIHRIPDNNSESKGSAGDAGQIEMVLLPTKEQKGILASVSSGQSEARSLVTLPVARTVKGSSVSTNISGTKLLGHVTNPKSDVHQTSTRVSQKTTSIVRDFLSQQNSVDFQNHPLLSVPQLSTQPSALTVLDFAAETRNLLQKKQIITLTRHPPAAVAIDTAVASPAGCPPSTTIMLPAVSSSHTFSQGQVIDLSKNKVQELNASTLKLTSSLIKSESEQGNIIGISGAILSVAAPKLERQDYLPKEGICKQILKKRGRKSLKSPQSFPSVAESGLGKINSETDEKLKKFLDAKKLENASSILSDNVEGMLDERTNGTDLDESGTLRVRTHLGSSEGWVDETYKTVGIFSGNVQNVKVGKKLNMSPSAGTSNTTSLSLPLSATISAVPSSLSSSTLGASTEVSADHSENIGVTFSKFVAAMDTVGKHITLKKVPESGSQTKDIHENSSSKKNTVEISQVHLPKKSRKSKKPLSIVVTKSTDRNTRMLIKKGQTSQSDNNEISEIRKLSSFKVEKKPTALVKQLSSSQGQKRHAKSLLSSTLLQTMKNKDEKPGKKDNMQTVLSASDSSHKTYKRQRRKKGESQEIGLLEKSVPAYTNKTSLAEGGLASTEVREQAGSNVDILKAISVDYGGSRPFWRSEASHMEVDDDDDSDEQPALCI